MLTLQEAEEFARELATRAVVEGDRIRPELLRREDAILVLWRELERVREDRDKRIQRRI